MNKKLTLTGANILFLVFCAVFLTYQLIAGIIMGDKIYEHMYAIVLVNEFVILASVLIYCFAKRINIREAFRFNNPGAVPSLLIIAISVPAAYAAGMFNGIVVYFLQFIGDIPAMGLPVPRNLQELMLGILLVAVVPGICEEMMHRGLLLRAYEKRGSYKAVVIVAIFFGLFHFDVTNLLGPVFLGLLIGYYVVRTNSIIAGMLAHFMNNAVAEITVFLTREPETGTLTMSNEELYATLFWGIAGLAATAILLTLFKKATDGRAEIIPPISGARQDIRAVLTHWPVILVIVLYILMAMMYILTIVASRIIGP